MSSSLTSTDPQQVRQLLGNTQPTSLPGGVEQIETHISWVFLTDHFAYKLKKPVRFEFLDFSTPALRHQACMDEVRLNRRLAPDVYLDVVAIATDEQGRLCLGGEGTPIDWLVKMRRLPAERSLDRLMAAGAMTPAEMDRIADLLCRFFAQVASVNVEREAFCQSIERHVRANAAELEPSVHQVDPSQVHRICGAHLRWLRLRQEVLEARLTAGRVIEGHGDLRPEHIYLQNGNPVVIDCIEFSRELRTLDVADELSFLAMECDRLGAEAMGDRLMDVYQQRSGDRPPAELWAFYKSYRACVRAKVAALRSVQQPPQEQFTSRATCRAHLDLADRYVQQLMPPLLLVVRGLMGSGKSTLAAALAETLGMVTLATDAVRRELYPPTKQPAGYGEEIYTADARQRVYAELLSRARALLAQGTSVILDGTFLTNALRRRAIEAGRAADARTLIVTCACPKDVANERIRNRLSAGSSLSDARPELLAFQERDDESPADDLPLFSVDGTLPLADQQQAVIARLVAQDLSTSTGQ